MQAGQSMYQVMDVELTPQTLAKEKCLPQAQISCTSTGYGTKKSLKYANSTEKCIIRLAY
jgi:hypothetical protein